MKTEVERLVIAKFINVPAILIKLKEKVNDLDFCKLKTLPNDLKNLNDVVDKQVVKNTNFNTLKTKVNNLDNKIPDATA